MRVGFTPFHENNVTRLVLEVPQFGSVLLIEDVSSGPKENNKW